MTPALEEVLASAVPFALPLRVRFRGLEVREGVLIKGANGWGEFAPFDDYDDERAARWLQAAIEAAWGSWPLPLRDSIEVNAIIPDVDSQVAGSLAREAVHDFGCTTMKVKVGRSLAEDEARVVAVRDALETAGVDGLIRLDANAAWTLEQATTAVRRLVPYGIEYIEQPCADLDDVSRLRDRFDVPVAVDESIRMSTDVDSLQLAGRVDYAIIKPMTVGGVHATLRLAERIGVPVVISGSLDSGVGLSTSLAAAASLPQAPVVSGLGTGALLERDLTDPSVLPQRGRIAVRRYAPDLDALVAASDAIGSERATWWRDRLARVYDVYARSARQTSVEG